MDGEEYDMPHTVVVVGRMGNGKRYVNVVGPFETKQPAITYAAKLRRHAAKEGLNFIRGGITIHARPLILPEDTEE